MYQAEAIGGVLTLTAVILGVWYQNSGPANTTETGLDTSKPSVTDNAKIPEHMKETSLDTSEPFVLNKAEIMEYVKEKAKEAVQNEKKKLDLDQVTTREVQKYQKGEVQGVLTPELLDEMISSSVKKALERYDDQLQEKVDKLSELANRISKQRKIEYAPEKPESDTEERLRIIENFMLEKEMSSKSYYVMITHIMTAIYKIYEFYKKDFLCCLLGFVIRKLFWISESDPLVLIQSAVCRVLLCSISIIKCICLGLSLVLKQSKEGSRGVNSAVINLRCGCITDVITVYNGFRYFLPSLLEFFIRKLAEYMGFDVPFLQKVLERIMELMEVIFYLRVLRNRYKASKNKEPESVKMKKHENSICAISFSSDYVEKYHVPLVKSLTEYAGQKDLRLKRAVIREPKCLDTIPPSKIFMVFVDYNEKNDLLEPDNLKTQQEPKNLKTKPFPIRKETVRSLIDSLVLVIFVYCMEESSKNLPHGDRYAHKLSNKVLAVRELKELDDKNCVFSVYKSFNTFQLGALKQIIEDYLKNLKDIVS